MQTTSYTTRVLTAESGHYLTQSADVPAGERAVTTKVYLAANADAADWREITAEEADAIRAAQAEAETERQAKEG